MHWFNLIAAYQFESGVFSGLFTKQPPQIDTLEFLGYLYIIGLFIIDEHEFSILWFAIYSVYFFTHEFQHVSQRRSTHKRTTGSEILNRKISTSISKS